MEQLSQYLKSQGVETAYLFGSRSRGTARSDSDWDLAVEFETELTGLEAMSRLALLEIGLKKLLNAPVDVVDLKMAQLTLLYEAIWRGKCLFCPDEEKRVARELAIRRRFEDYRDIQAFYTRAREERLSEVSCAKQ